MSESVISSVHNIVTMKYCFILLLLVSMSLEITAQDPEEVEYQDESFSASEFSFSQSASLSIFDRIPCVFRGALVMHGGTHKIDRCTECRCKNGTTSCHIETCEPDPRCGANETIVEEGECCPHCPYSNPTRNCSFRGTILQHKQGIRLDPCTMCTCGAHGRTHCHIESCPGQIGCELNEIIHIPTLCCPQCPYKLVVRGVRIFQDLDPILDEGSSNKVKFSLHVTVEKKTSSATVRGEHMWQLRGWMSENIDGSGRRISYNPNIFNAENAAKPYHRRSPHNFKWPGLEYRIELEEGNCGNYFCVEFDQGNDSRPLHDIPFTFQPFDDRRENLVGCLSISNCNVAAPRLHPDLTSKYIFERKLGDSITFKCNVSDAEEVWWHHSSWAQTKRVKSNNTFRVDNISLEDQGRYHCVVKAHGQHIRSAEQVLIIPGMAQFLLRIDANDSIHNSRQKIILYQNYIVSQMENVNILAIPVNASSETTQTIHLSKAVNLGQELNSIRLEILNIVEKARNVSTLTAFSNVTARLEGLSLCSEDSVTTEAGYLSFSSANINSEMSSNELCVVPSELPRGTRRCEGDVVTSAKWRGAQVHNCFASSNKETTRKSVESFFEIMDKRTVTENNVSFVSRDLVDITTASTIGMEEVTKITSILERVCLTSSSSLLVASNVLRTVDKIIDTFLTGSSEDGILPCTTSSRILKSVELQLENVQKSGQNFSISLPNIEVEVVQVSDINAPFSFVVCPVSNKTDSDDWAKQLHMTSEDHIPDCRNGTSIQIPTVVMNMSFNGKEQTVFPVTITSYQSDVLFNDEISRKGNRRLDSIIISASTSYKVENLPKGSFITTSFTSLSTDDIQRSCMFWDHSLYGKTGGWSSIGCHHKTTDDSNTHICECDHLTSFALMAHEDVKNDMDTALVVGCIVAIIFLLVTICIYLVIRELRSSMQHQVTLSLCMALLGLYFCFVLGIGRTDLNPGCVIFGGLIHYFCVSSVAWLNIDATVIYFSEAEFVTSHPGFILLTASAITWGLPSILVLLNAVVATESYSHGDYCLPSLSSPVFYVSLLGVVSSLFTYNIAIYFLISWKLRSNNKKAFQSICGKKTSRRLQRSLLIFVLFGLSWLFGFLAVEHPSGLYNTFFSLFSILLGFCIFLQYCLRQETVHDAWKRLLKLPPSESDQQILSQMQLND